MRRLRFFRILLPALLVPFLVLVVLEIKKRPNPWGSPAGSDQQGSLAEGVTILDIEGTELRFSIEARKYSGDEEEGWQSFEGVQKLEIGRENAPPLIISADRADIEGPASKRTMTVEGGIDVRDEDAGLMLSLPTLTVDEASGEARSIGEVRFSAPGYSGRADEVTYYLNGQPTRFLGVEIESTGGWSLSAENGSLLEGSDDIELSGTVRIKRAFDRISCGTMRIRRYDNGKLERVQAGGVVSGHATLAAGLPSWFKSDSAELQWDESGDLLRVKLLGQAFVQRMEQTIAASSIECSRQPEQDGNWLLQAAGDVFSRSILQGRPATLQADSVNLETDLAGAVVSGFATGQVRFENGPVLTEAEQVTLLRTAAGLLQARLTSVGDRKARLSSDNQRVAADVIVTRPADSYLFAEGRVEATLLPASERESVKNTGGLFRLSEAVHFVSEEMTSEGGGRDLLFKGTVRGWQGERNLSADAVGIRSNGDSLIAEGSVNTRIPRRDGALATQAEYIQVGSDRLEYSNVDRKALFTGDTRVTQAEGWMEATRLEATLAEEGGRMEFLRAAGDVRVEYRDTSAADDSPPISGTADRLEYDPDEQAVRLFGDDSHATVRRSGTEGGVTLGRVIRYWLETGEMMVESGGQDRSKIRTTGS